MFSINMFDSHMFFLLLSTWTWDTFLTLRGTQDFYLKHLLSSKPSKSYRVDGTASYIVAQLSNWPWDTCLKFRGSQGFYLNHLLPPRPSKSYRVVAQIIKPKMCFQSCGKSVGVSFPYLGIFSPANTGSRYIFRC